MHQDQQQNTAKLVMDTFYKVLANGKSESITASEITKYLKNKFGDVFMTSKLTNKAEETLRRNAALGFLERQGNRYIANLARELRCGKRRRKRRKSRRCGSRRRRRPRSCSRRRRKRRRRPSCGCGR